MVKIDLDYFNPRMLLCVHYVKGPCSSGTEVPCWLQSAMKWPTTWHFLFSGSVHVLALCPFSLHLLHICASLSNSFMRHIAHLTLILLASSSLSPALSETLIKVDLTFGWCYCPDPCDFVSQFHCDLCEGPPRILQSILSILLSFPSSFFAGIPLALRVTMAG